MSTLRGKFTKDYCRTIAKDYCQIITRAIRPKTHFKLGDSRNYMPPILVPSSAKCIATQILVIAKLNGRKDFILRVFVCDIIRPSKELPIQS